MGTDVKYLNVQEVALELRLSASSVYRMIEAGRLPAIRPGGEHGALRIPRDELDERRAVGATLRKPGPPRRRLEEGEA
jgi:excisionase family DNA binding protein